VSSGLAAIGESGGLMSPDGVDLHTLRKKFEERKDKWAGKDCDQKSTTEE
jgi:hypothetical protein